MGLRLSGVVERDIDAVEAWLEADDPGPAIVATSGSSGAPKQVVLSRDAVLASAAASAARLGGAGACAFEPLRWGCHSRGFSQAYRVCS